MLPNLYTREEVAEKLKVHPQTVDRWRKKGMIRGKNIGGIVRYPEEEVLRLIKINGKNH